MRIAICDDLKEDREYLSCALKEYFFENDMNMEVDIFRSGEEFLEKADSKNYDLMFLDIYMESITGVNVVRKVRETNSKSQIIFTTTSLEHGADSYEVDAFVNMILFYVAQMLFGLDVLFYKFYFIMGGLMYLVINYSL